MQYFLSMLLLFFVIFGLFYGGWLVWLAKGKDKVMGIILFLVAVFGLIWFIDGTWGIWGFFSLWGGVVVGNALLVLLGTIVGVVIPTVVIMIAMLD